MRKPAYNSSYPKVAGQWLNPALCFYQSLCLVDSELLRNRHLRIATNRCVQIKIMRHFLFLSLLFLPIVTNGQTKSDISLINDVLFETPYIDGNSYIQLDNKIHPCILNWDFEDYYSELKNHLDKKKLHELIRNANKAMSIDGEWKPNEIKNTIILSDTEITQLQLSNQNGVTKRLTQFYYVLSIPIYDETENYAVIRFGGGSARNNMVGSYFLLKIVKDKWIIITSFSSWAS